MKKFFLILGLVTLSTSAFANVMTFTCTTEKPLDGDKVRTIEFSLSAANPTSITIVSPGGGRCAFKVTPFSDAARALNTGDNIDVAADQNRVTIDADEIGMYHTTLVLWKASHLRTGYLSTGGESNVKLYSPLSCQVK